MDVRTHGRDAWYQRPHLGTNVPFDMGEMTQVFVLVFTAHCWLKNGTGGLGTPQGAYRMAKCERHAWVKYAAVGLVQALRCVNLAPPTQQQ